jgi:hypothetical protein
MEELKHYSSLRDKYAKELSQSFAYVSNKTRPQTAPKQVKFDFTEQLDLRELRNLREKHLIDLERITTPPFKGDYIENPPNEKKKNKQNGSRFRKSYNAIEKPAVQIEFHENYFGPKFQNYSSEIKVPKPPQRNRSFFEPYSSEIKVPRPPSEDNSFHSQYSGKSLAENLENIFEEAKRSLENSFRAEANTRPNQENSVVSRTKVSEKPLNRENINFSYSKTSEKVGNQENSILSRSKISENVGNPENSISSRSKVSEKVENRENSIISNSKVSEKIEIPHRQLSQSENPLKNFEELENIKVLNPTLLEKTMSFELHQDDDSIRTPSKSKILYPNAVEKPPNFESDIESISMRSDIEEELKNSLKSSMDFSISDQTPFESLKFSQENNYKIKFSQYYENLKKGIYYKLLYPIIQALKEQEYTDTQRLKIIQTKFDRSIDKIEDLEVRSFLNSIKPNPEEFSDYNILRTSRSEPFRTAKFEDSVYSHNSIGSILSNYNPKFEDMPNSSILLEGIPKQPRLNFEFLEEKSLLLLRALENAALALLATNVCYSFFLIKSRSSKLKNKLEKLQLASANYDYTLLKKVIGSWAYTIKSKNFYDNKQIKQFAERWKFIKLYQTFQGFKFVCKAHRQWIKEVKDRVQSNKKIFYFKNWALYVRFRGVKQYLKFRKIKAVIEAWRRMADAKKNFNKNACVHWYFKTISKSFDHWAAYKAAKKEKYSKKAAAEKLWTEKIYTKIFLSWKHSKALYKASYIPIRINTKTTLSKKQGNIQEKSLLDIKIIRN